MTLIEEIQREAIDSTSDLGALLRKCKLLAAKLGSSPLEDWLLWESSGYPNNVDVPSYRIFALELKGHFSGSFGAGLRNAPIPMMCLPENARDSYQNYMCRQSIASIETILKQNNKGRLQVSTGDLAVLLGENVYEHKNCIQAWAELGVGNFTELLNTVRNRILDFTLAVWKEAPTAGEGSDKVSRDIEPSRVTQIFNTTVYGGAANLVGSATNSSISITVSQNDIASLEKALRDNGVQDKDIKELNTAITTDERPQKDKGFGPRVSSWVANMMKKAADGSWTIGLQTAGNLLYQAISKYYGL
ncbi:MAG: AbiTii domain-containing protein [Candidatus Scalindua sp.]